MWDHRKCGSLKKSSLVNLSFLAHQSDLGQSELHSALFFECRALSKIAQEMSSSNDPSTIPDLTAQVTHTFEALCTVKGS